MKTDYSARVKKLKATLKEKKLDALLVSGLSNVRYLCGFSGSSGLLWVGLRGTIFFTDFRYQEQAKKEVGAQRRIIIKKSLLEDFAALPEVRRTKRLGYEAGHLLCSQYEFLRQRLSGVKLIPTDGLVEYLRRTKDPQELTRISRAAAIADRAFTAILKYLKPGRTEQQVANQLDYYLKYFGAEKPSFDSIVASGPNGALPHARPGERRLRKGDFIVLDFGAKYQGYCSDMTRTVLLGRPTDKHLKIYHLVQQAQQAGLEAVRAGQKGRDADLASREVIEEAGYGKYFGHSLGHGVGLEVHEGPRLSRLSEDTLAPGQVVTVEPGIYLPGWGGVRIEDLVAVTEKGGQVFSRSPKKLICIS